MNSKKKNYLYSIVFGTVFLFFIFLIIPYLLNEIKKASESSIILRDELASIEKEIENLHVLKAAYQDRKDDLGKIDDIFIDNERPVDFFNFLRVNAQVTQQNIDISVIPSGQSKDDPWLNLSFQVSTKGSFSNFLKFLERIENSPYLIEILNLNCKELTKGEFPFGSVESSFQIKVFTKK